MGQNLIVVVVVYYSLPVWPCRGNQDRCALLWTFNVLPPRWQIIGCTVHRLTIITLMLNANEDLAKVNTLNIHAGGRQERLASLARRVTCIRYLSQEASDAVQPAMYDQTGSGSWPTPSLMRQTCTSARSIPPYAGQIPPRSHRSCHIHVSPMACWPKKCGDERYRTNRWIVVRRLFSRFCPCLRPYRSGANAGFAGSPARRCPSLDRRWDHMAGHWPYTA